LLPIGRTFDFAARRERTIGPPTSTPMPLCLCAGGFWFDISTEVYMTFLIFFVQALYYCYDYAAFTSKFGFVMYESTYRVFLFSLS
jgi:hypothetical protein